MFSDMLKAMDNGMPPLDLTKLKAAITGGAIASPELVRDLRNKFPFTKVVVSLKQDQLN